MRGTNLGVKTYFMDGGLLQDFRATDYVQALDWIHVPHAYRGALAVRIEDEEGDVLWLRVEGRRRGVNTRIR